MSLFNRIASSRIPLASDARRGSLATFGISAMIDTPPKIDASGVRNSCETEPINASRN